MHELEAKFLVAAGRNPKRVLRRVLQELRQLGYVTQPQGRDQIEDTYCDTADGRLRRSRWSYRLRQAAGRRKGKAANQTITLKRTGTGHGGVFNRTEIEQTMAPAAAASRDALCRVPQGGRVADALHQVLPADAVLQPLFTVRNTRARYLLTHAQHPEVLIELAMDRVRIRAHTSLRFAELEFELKGGDRTFLSDVVTVLDTQPDLYRARVGKFLRGMQAMGCEPSRGAGVAAPIDDARCRWADLSLQHLQVQLRQLRNYEPMAWESVHPEGVHQMRVATRRVRAALRAFDNVLPPEEAALLVSHVRWLGRSLGAVRDLDVQLQHAREQAQYLGRRNGKALRDYYAHLRQARRQAHRALLVALASDRYQQLLAAYSQLMLHTPGFEGPQQAQRIEQAAHELVLPMLHRLVGRGRRIDDNSRPEKLHRLRMDVKRLRYLLEYIEGPYAPALDPVTRRLGRLQDTLGNHQDAYVAMDQLQAYCDQRILTRPERKAFKRLLQHEQRNAAKYRGRFQRDWRRFERQAQRVAKLL